MGDGDALLAYRVFHRTVKTDPPSRRDFESNRERGNAPRGDELRDSSLYGGLSVIDTLVRAIARARKFPMHGSYVVELTIPVGEFIHWKRTGKSPGHFTIWGNADAIMACVTRIIDVDAQEEGRPCAQ